jgi:hypothetical protein
VIDHDVQNGDLKSARHFIRLALDKKIDSQVLGLTEVAATKALITDMKNAQQKVEALQKIVEVLVRPVASTTKEDLARTEAELTPLAKLFCELPFNPTACPESAAEIRGILNGKLRALKERSPAVRRVVEEIEKKCLLVDRDAPGT